MRGLSDTVIASALVYDKPGTICFSLGQNYPNPFNPTTIIKYSIPKETQVLIKVYDVLGNEIQTLVNETKQQGIYNVVFDGSRLSSGIYFYTIKAGSFIAAKKLILLK